MSKVDVVDGTSGATTEGGRGDGLRDGHGDMADRVRRRFSKADDDLLGQTSKLSRKDLDDALSRTSQEGCDERDEGGQTREFVSISLDAIDKAGREEREVARRERQLREEAERAAAEAAEAERRAREEAEAAAAAEAVGDEVPADAVDETVVSEVADGGIEEDSVEPDMSGMTIVDDMPVDGFDGHGEDDEPDGLDVMDGIDDIDDGDDSGYLEEDDDEEADDGTEGRPNRKMAILIGALVVVLVALVGFGVYLHTKPGETQAPEAAAGNETAASESKVKVSGVYFGDNMMSVAFDPAGNDRLNLSVTPVDASGSAVRGESGGALFGDLRWSSSDSSSPTVSIPMSEEQFSQVESLTVDVVGAEFDDSFTASALGDARREVAAAARAREVEEADAKREELRQKRLDEEAAAAAKKKAEEEAAKKKAEEEAKKKAEEEARKKAEEEARRNASNNTGTTNGNNNNNNNSNNNNNNNNNNQSAMSEADKRIVEHLTSAGGSSTDRAAVIDTSAMRAYLLTRSGDSWSIKKSCDVYQDFGQTGAWEVVDTGHGPNSAACADGSYDHMVVFWKAAVDYISTIDGHETAMYDDSYWQMYGICAGPDLRSSAVAHASDGVISLPSSDIGAFFDGLTIGSRVVVV